MIASIFFMHAPLGYRGVARTPRAPSFARVGSFFVLAEIEAPLLVLGEAHP
jgi:hypothetical protein